jgi:hypothetical protein
MSYGVDRILHMATGKVEYGVVHQSTGRVVVKGSKAAMIDRMNEMNAREAVHPIFEAILANFKRAA